MGRAPRFRGFIRPFADRPDVLVDYVWYAVPWTNGFGYPTVFCDRFYEEKDQEWWEGVGTALYSMKYFDGPHPARNVRFGDDDEDAWINGLSYAAWLRGDYADDGECAFVGLHWRDFGNQALGSYEAPLFTGTGDQAQDGGSGLSLLVSGQGAEAQDGGSGLSLLVSGQGAEAQDGGSGLSLLVSGQGAEAQDGGSGLSLLVSGSGAEAQDGTGDFEVVPPPEDFVLVYTSDFTNVATVDVTGLTGYSWYLVQLFEMRANGGLLPGLWLRTSTDNGATFDAGASDYRQETAFADDSKIVLGSTLPSNSANTKELAITLWLYSLDSSTAYKGLHWIKQQDDAGTLSGARDSGVRKSATAVNAFRVLGSSGNLDGRIRVYGYA